MRLKSPMKTRLAVLTCVFLLMAASAFAHRLDEYLQATTIAVEKDRVTLKLRLCPGVEVARKVLAEIHTNGDGIISDAEQQSYVERLRRDLSLTIDGQPVQPRLVSSTFPKVEELIKGVGNIQIEFEADIPPGGSEHKLSLENRHHSAIAAYLVNCLVPRDPSINIITQNRNYLQSSYQLDFAVSQSGEAVATPSGLRQWLDQSSDLAVIKTYFCHGVHHILTGYDHLLFLSALVLAATTLWDLVKLVTAFTVAHSITLTLAALDLIHLPEGIVEPLIAASIVFVAAQNIFLPESSQGRSRLAVVFFFGLFHGLGFASGLLNLMHAMQRETIILAVLGFSIGIEAGHLLVLLPLFGFLTAARRTRREDVARAQLSMTFQRVGSVGILVAGVYFFYMAVMGVA
jgi:hydrogenase/urease accessory protein HupE